MNKTKKYIIHLIAFFLILFTLIWILTSYTPSSYFFDFSDIYYAFNIILFSLIYFSTYRLIYGKEEKGLVWALFIILLIIAFFPLSGTIKDQIKKYEREQIDSSYFPKVNNHKIKKDKENFSILESENLILYGNFSKGLTNWNAFSDNIGEPIYSSDIKVNEDGITLFIDYNNEERRTHAYFSNMIFQNFSNIIFENNSEYVLTLNYEFAGDSKIINSSIDAAEYVTFNFFPKNNLNTYSSVENNNIYNIESKISGKLLNEAD